MSDLAGARQPGDPLDGGTIVRGPRRSEKWGKGRVWFEVRMPDGRVRTVSYPDTERVQ